jgi:outer membrane lipoprotein SlyB
MSTKLLSAVAMGSAFFFAACSAQRPVLYPNAHLKGVGSSAAERDIQQCMQQAEDYIASGGGGGKVAEETAVGAGTGAAVGAAAGAAGGAVVGRAGTSAAVGAAGGGAAGATRGLIRGLAGKRSPSPVYKNFVNRCLRERGYDPIGWD